MNKNNDLKKAIEMAIIRPESENMDSLEPYEHDFSHKYKKEIAKAKKIADKSSGKRNIGFYYRVSSVIAAALVLTGVLTFTANEKLRNAINNWHVGDEFLAPTEDKTDTTYTTIITDTAQPPSGSQEPADISQTATEDSGVIDTTADMTEKNTETHSSTDKSSYVITDPNETAVTASVSAVFTKPSASENTTHKTVISSASKPHSNIITTKITAHTTGRTTKKTSAATHKTTTANTYTKPQGDTTKKTSVANEIKTTVNTKHTTKSTTAPNDVERPTIPNNTSLVTATYIVIVTETSKYTFPVSAVTVVELATTATTTTTTTTMTTTAADPPLYQEKILPTYYKTYTTKIKQDH